MGTSLTHMGCTAEMLMWLIHLVARMLMLSHFVQDGLLLVAAWLYHQLRGVAGRLVTSAADGVVLLCWQMGLRWSLQMGLHGCLSVASL